MFLLNEYFNLVNDFFINNVIGKIILSIISSFIFILLLLKTMRPKLKISEKACYSEIDGIKYYVFKIVNMSYYDLYDIRIKLTRKTPYLANKGSKINYQLNDLNLSSNHEDHFAKFKWKKGYGDHALLLRTDHDLESDIRDNDISVRLTITARHGLTNLTRIKSQDFNSINQIFKEKEFKFGRSLDVL